ncbi:MAG: M3 family oligoendopeptidase [Halanaerobiales bacterium]|nr:M3 family oligoendopeptidase [Halanaerobiales bacterium]
MKKRWSLDTLYTGFDSKKFKEDFKQLEKSIKKIQNFNLKKNESNVKKAENFLKLVINYRELLTTLSAYSNLKASVNVNNEKALKMIEKIEKKRTKTTKAEVNFQLWLSKIRDCEELYDKSDLLSEHEFFIDELVKQSKYLLSEDVEDMVAQMKQTGSSAWTKLQEKLTSTLLVEIKIDGEIKKLPLPVVRNMAHDKDQTLRKKAYKAELKSYQKIEKGVAAALNGIKGEVITLTEKRGYSSPLEKSLDDSRVDKSTLKALLKAIEEKLKLFRKFYERKASILEHKNGLPFYDLFAPLGEVEMDYNYQEAKDFIIDNINDFDQEMALFYHKAFENNWIDIEPRDGKRGGAFCYNIHPIKESRVLSNFTGSFSDVTTLAHELGHAYHGHCLEEESIINSNYPMPLAETASILSETIVTNAALKKADKKQKYSILESKITSAGQVIVDIYSRYIFESELFKKRRESSLSVDELKETMIYAQKKAYGDSLDYDHLHPYMWLNKPHYYSANYNYYNFPYAFGLLFGLGVYALSQEEGNEFVKKYNDLLKETGKNSVKDVGKMIGIDLDQKTFWLKSLNVLKDNIDEFIRLTD